MTASLMNDAFGHHVWATLRLLDGCASLTTEQLASGIPGTYGSILDTLRHLVGSDAGYLSALTGGARPRIDEDSMDLAGLRAEMELDGDAWRTFLAQDPDAEVVVVRHRDDGSETHASI